MRYKDMLQEAKAHGVTSEVIMWGSIDDLDDILHLMKEEHPEEYWKFMRKQHGRLYKNHYDQKFAEYDVSQIHYTDKTGKMHHGAHWTADEVEEATKGMPFPSDVTKWDKYVAFNSFYADCVKNCLILTSSRRHTHSGSRMKTGTDTAKSGNIIA